MIKNYAFQLMITNENIFLKIQNVYKLNSKCL